MEYRFDAAARYTRTHEWVRVEGGEAVIGVSDYAQHSLSDVVFVEVPGPGTPLTPREALHRDREREGGRGRDRARQRHGDREEPAPREGARAGQQGPVRRRGGWCG